MFYNFLENLAVRSFPMVESSEQLQGHLLNRLHLFKLLSLHQPSLVYYYITNQMLTGSYERDNGCHLVGGQLGNRMVYLVTMLKLFHLTQ